MDVPHDDDPAPNANLVVFASDKNRAVAGQQLHTNFKLDADGDYLGLTRPDGTVASEYLNPFPAQQEDVSYGIPTAGAATNVLVGPAAPAKVTIPANGSLGTSWTTPGFVDSSWTSATTGVGYEIASTSPSLPVEIEVNNTAATANDASANFVSVAGLNLYHMGLKGSVSPANDLDYYNIGDLQVGDILTVAGSGLPSASATRTLPNPYVELWRNNNGSPVQVTFDNDSGPGVDALIHRYSISAADTYFVVAHSVNIVDTGTYDLGVYLEIPALPRPPGGAVTAEVEPNNSIAAANDASTSWRAIQYKSTTTATFSNSVDFYKFTFTAGDVVTFNADSTSSTLDMKLTVYGSNGTTVIGSEDGSSAGRARTTRTRPSTASSCRRPARTTSRLRGPVARGTTTSRPTSPRHHRRRWRRPIRGSSARMSSRRCGT